MQKMKADKYIVCTFCNVFAYSIYFYRKNTVFEATLANFYFILYSIG